MKQVLPTNSICSFVKILLGKKHFAHALFLIFLISLLMPLNNLLSAQDYCNFEEVIANHSIPKQYDDNLSLLPSSLGIKEHLQRSTQIIDGNNNVFLTAAAYDETNQIHQVKVQKVGANGGDWITSISISQATNGIIPAAICADKQGNILVAGTYHDNGIMDYDGFVVKLNPLGSVLWKDYYAGAANGFDGWFSITTDANGKIWVGGATTPTGIDPDLAVVAYSAAGAQLWVSETDIAGEIDLAIQISYQNNNIFASGVTEQASGAWGLLNKSMNASTGSSVAQTSTLGSSNTSYKVEKLIPDAANNQIHILGTITKEITPGVLGSDFYVAKVNTQNGQVTWETPNLTQDLGDIRARSAVMDANGNLFAIGAIYGTTTKRDLAVTKYGSNGAEVWTKTFDGDETDEEGYDITIDNAGNLYLTGYTNETTGNQDFLTMKIDTSGNELWRKTYNGIHNDADIGYAVRLDDNENVLVTGQVGDEVAVVRYKNECTVELPETEAYSGSIAFIENKGQLLDTDGNAMDDIKFKSDVVSPAHYFFDDKVSFVQYTQGSSDSTIDAHRVDMSFRSDGRNTGVYPLERQSDYYNYYLGHISEGRERVPLYKSLVHANAFSKVDVQYAGKTSGMSYSFIVKPGGDPLEVILIFDGQDSLSVNNDGELVIGTSTGDIILPEPRAYQVDANGDVVYLNWTPDYDVSGSNVSFDVGSYDGNKDLVIEVKRVPESVCETDNFGIEYSTYYGGGMNDQATDMSIGAPTFGVASNTGGNIYFTGWTESSNFPILNGPVNSLQGTISAFVVSLSELERDWATYFGGTFHGNELGCETFSYSVTYDISNEFIYFAGDTDCQNLPVTSLNTFPDVDDYIGPLPPLSYDNIGFLAKLNIDGEKIYATYFAGGEDNSSVTNLSLSSNGNLFMSGFSRNSFDLESNDGDFFQGANANGEGFVVEFDKDSRLIWSTQFGSESTTIRGIDVYQDNQLVIVGDLYSGEATTPIMDFANQPLINDHFSSTFSGVSDAFIAKFDISGDNRDLIWSTLFSGNDRDFGSEVAFNSNGEIYFAGTTNSDSPSFPTMTSYGNDSNKGCSDIFVAKFSNLGEPLFCGFYGGTDLDGSSGSCANPFLNWKEDNFDIAFDFKDNFYLTSETQSNDFSLTNFSSVYNQSVFGNDNGVDNNDVVIICLNKEMEETWSTYFGGTNNGTLFEQGVGIALAGEYIYLTGSTASEW